MAGKFDFSKLSEKLDIKGMVEGVKSIINPEVGLPKDLEGDPVAAKLALIKMAADNLNELMQKQQEEVNKINVLINSLYKDLALKKAPTKTTTTEQSPETKEEDKK